MWFSDFSRKLTKQCLRFCLFRLVSLFAPGASAEAWVQSHRVLEWGCLLFSFVLSSGSISRNHRAADFSCSGISRIFQKTSGGCFFPSCTGDDQNCTPDIF